MSEAKQPEETASDPSVRVEGAVSRPDFSKWTANVEVSVWGRGKATADKSECPMESPPKAGYKGDCDNCDMFMGIKFPENLGTVHWGDRFKGCCWAKVANNPAHLRE